MQAKSSRQIRVFISSTFRDMQAERDHLVKFIFPQLRKLCEQRGIAWSEVDLRWGITDEQSAEEQVLPICLQEIQNCRPYFIGILGERYGWVPDKISLELIEREPWLVEQLDHSVTELEILHGVLNNPDMAGRALFYFRDPDFVAQISTEEKVDFTEHPRVDEIEQYGLAEAQKRAEDRRRKLAALKERIRRSGLPLKEGFESPKELGEWVLADLTALINQEYPENSKPNPLQRETQIHEAFAASRMKVYIGGEKYYKKIDEHLAESNAPLVVVGESGLGKSALLANWGMRYRQTHPNELVILHFIGASASSSDLAGMLHRIMGELKENFDIQKDLPTDLDELRASFPRWLYRAGQKGKVVLILDALNQIEDRHGAQELTWLPLELPENIHIILSTLPGKTLKAISERKYRTLTIEPLSLQEREQLVKTFLKQYSKQLNKQRMQRIVEYPHSENPLGLRILLEELRQFGSYEELDKPIYQFLNARSIPGMLDLVLARCEEDYEQDRPGLVGDTMRYIWTARQGISEKELLDLLGKNGMPLMQRIWAPLHLAIESALFERTGLINFFHDYMRQAVEQRYLRIDEEKRKAHLVLAEYFEGMEDNPPRKVEELPWQLQQVGEWQRLYGLLADLDFFEKIWIEHHNDLYMYWSSIEKNTNLDKVQAYKNALANSKHKDNVLMNWIALFFQETGYLEDALAMHKEEERISRQTGNLNILQTSLGNQACILQNQGKPEEALLKHKEEESICRQLGDMDNLQISIGNQAAILIEQGKLESAMRKLEEKEQICRQLKNLEDLQASLGNQAVILRRQNKLEQTYSILKEQERMCRQLGHMKGLSQSLGNQALILKMRGELEEAMGMHKKEEHICRQMGDWDGISISLGNQAVILHTWGRLLEAMEVHKEEERICRQLDDLNGLQASIGNQAAILHRQGKLKEAMGMYREKERINRELGNSHSLCISLSNQGLILQAWGKLEEALELYKEEELIGSKNNDIEGLCDAWLQQGLIFIKQGDKQEGVRLVNKAYAQANRYGYTAITSQIRAIFKK